MPELDETPDAAPRRRGLPTGARVGGRLLVGAVAVAAAAAVIGVVAFVPLPTVGAVPDGVEVTPVPGDALRVCTGSVLRLGTETGEGSDTAHAIGAPSLTAGSLGGAEPERSSLDAGAEADGNAVPLVLRSPAGEQPVGARSQQLDVRDFSGMTATTCLEPAGSAWLVGGSTTVGRTSLLTLANPSEVDAVATVRLWGESGPVAAAGMGSVTVRAGSQRVIPLSGFAPGLASPVVEVNARGGRIIAGLQQSIVRGLDAGGTEIVAPGAAPAESLVIPGIRISAATSVAAAESRSGWHDAGPSIRLLSPDQTTEAVVVLTPAAGQGGSPSTFVLELQAGAVTELPITSGLLAEELNTLPDGLYTVAVTAGAPVVAGVRTSTATEPEADPLSPIPPAPRSDFAWFTATEPLGADAVVAIPSGPVPVLSLVNPGIDDAVVDIAGVASGTAVPAGATVAIRVPTGRVLAVVGAAGLHASVSFAGAGQLAAFPLAAPRPLAGPVLIRI